MAERMVPAPWPPKPVWHSGGYHASPRPTEGVVTWNINTTCNYRCSYCTQRFLEDRSRWAKDTAAFLAGFAQLSGAWEIKISGGEPFLHPTLLEIAAGLRQLGHAVSIVTNFSASQERLGAFLEAAAESLRVFSASLHLEYLDSDEALEDFAQKAQFVQAHLPKDGFFNITCVATHQNLSRLWELHQWFANRDLHLKVQPEKQNREIIDYTPEQQALLLQLGGHNQLGELAFSFTGRPCWAGVYSFTLDDKGEAWRCYPARRYRAQYLGNFLDGSFVLARGPSPCLYHYCNCTVPISRGMMPRDPTPHEVACHASD